MTDFRPAISTNLCIYPGIVERIEDLNHILNELDASGFGKLVQNFCTQPDPETAHDLLFEIWICQMLRRNQDVQDLQYEPSDTIEFIPLSFWYDAPLTSRDSDRRHDSWLVYGSPKCRIAPQSFWI